MAGEYLSYAGEPSVSNVTTQGSRITTKVIREDALSWLSMAQLSVPEDVGCDSHS